MSDLEQSKPERIIETAEALGLPDDVQQFLEPPFHYWMHCGILARFSPSLLEGVWMADIVATENTPEVPAAIRRILVEFNRDQKPEYVLAEVRGNPVQSETLRAAGFSALGQIPLTPAIELFGWRMSQ